MRIFSNDQFNVIVDYLKKIWADSRADSTGHGDTELSNNSAKTSAGLFHPSVLRGRSLSSSATLSRSAWVCNDRSVPFGKYCRNNPLVFSLVPRCHGE